MMRPRRAPENMLFGKLAAFVGAALGTGRWGPLVVLDAFSMAVLP